MSIMKISPEAMHETAHMFSIDNYHPLTAMFGRDETASGLGYTIYMVFENFEKRDMDIAKAVFDPHGHLEYETLDHMLVDWLDELKKNEGSYKFDEEIAFIESMFKPNKCKVTIKVEME